MAIDFHSHIFPDKIAEKTIKALASSATVTAYSNGTESMLNEKIEEAGLNFALSLPVLTKPTQFESVLNFALSVNEKFKSGKGKILSFAGVHPDSDDIERDIIAVKKSGIKGIKIHPEYQNTFIDDEKYIRLLKFAKEYDLITVTHAGVDDAYLDRELRCSPKRVLNALDKIGGYQKLVLAHLGGNRIYEEVYSVLAGKDFYFDTAFVLKETSKDKFVKMIEKHGEDKILFASDSPWSDIKEDVGLIKSFNLKKETEEKILYKNALKLLGEYNV